MPLPFDLLKREAAIDFAFTFLICLGGTRLGMYPQNGFTFLKKWCYKKRGIINKGRQKEASFVGGMEKVCIKTSRKKPQQKMRKNI